ncbi:MAG TPA: hypothetical protein VD902_02200 [Symbiobacteriaceae bacterium]|nr:hypothetical protein [Symbiobacteriaceae bacterium]
MKKSWIIAGALIVGILGTVAVAEARGGGGVRMMGGAPGTTLGTTDDAAVTTYGMGMRGTMGPMMGGRGGRGGPGAQGGMMGGRGGMWSGAVTPGANYDPVAIKARLETMLTQQEAMVTTLEAQLAAATDELVKARIEVRLEWAEIMLGHTRNQLTVVPTLPADWLQGCIMMAEADVAYFSTATATDSRNQLMIESHLLRAQQRLAYLEAEAAKAQN